MLNNKVHELLQLFADGGAGTGTASGSEGSANTGVTSVDAAQTLRGLGVPEAKIGRYGKRYQARANMAAPVVQQETVTPKEEQQDAAAETETTHTEEPTEEPKEAAKGFDPEAAKKDPAFQKYVSDLIRERTKKSREAETALSALTPALQEIARKNGMDPEHMDYTALSKHLTGEYERKAMESGVPKEAVARMDMLERLNEEGLNRQHYADLVRQSEELKKVFPTFDLDQELRNPEFLRRTSRAGGMSVEDAFWAAHHRDISLQQAQVVEQKAVERVQNTIRAGAARPDESGSTYSSAPVTQKDWRHATKAELEAQKQKILAAAAQGRRLRPGE